MSPQRMGRQCLTAVIVFLLCAVIVPAALADSDTLAVLSGYVYVDWNHDLVRDQGDFVIANAVVQLTKDDDPNYLPLLVTTDATGLYHFDISAPGTYTIRQLTAANVEGQQFLGTLVGTDSQNNRIELPPGTAPNPATLPSDFLKDAFARITIPTGYANIIGTGYNVAASRFPLALVSKRFLMDIDPPVPVPEPAALLLLAAGGLAAGAWAWRRRNCSRVGWGAAPAQRTRAGACAPAYRLRFASESTSPTA